MYEKTQITGLRAECGPAESGSATLPSARLILTCMFFANKPFCMQTSEYSFVPSLTSLNGDP